MTVKLPINISDLLTRRLADLQAGKAVSRRYRNRRIGEFLKELDLTEGRSTGLPKIFRKMTQNGSPKPIFETEEDCSYFLVRLPVHEAFYQPETLDEEITPTVHQVTDQVTDQVKRLLNALANEPLSVKTLLSSLSLLHRPTLMQNYLQPALDAKLVEMTQPDSPRSPTQKYRLTALGKQLLAIKDKREG